MDEESIIVSNVAHPFGEEVTRVTLFRLFLRFGRVAAMHISPSKAVITMTRSSDAQSALAGMHRFLLFGNELTVAIAPDEGSKPLVLCDEPSPVLLFEEVQPSWVRVALQAFKGIKEIVEVEKKHTLVVTEGVSVASEIQTATNGLQHPCGPLSVSFVRSVRNRRSWDT